MYYRYFYFHLNILAFLYWSNFQLLVDGKQICIELTARFANATPDGVMKEIITINNRFPGPTIRATIGDTLTIRVRNRLLDSSGVRHPTSVHFHGIEMRFTPWFDGPEQVSQCPIPYNNYMDYTFTLYQSGTYWYHSHHNWQYIDGFWGLLVVDNAPNEVHKYDDELLLTLTDWHHRSGGILSDLLHLPQNPSVPEAGRTPTPDSALINGRGNADCTDAMALYPNIQCDGNAANIVTVFDVFPQLTYRIRVVNPSARASFNFSIDGHQLRTIEVDGVDTVETPPVDVVKIYPAQRYSFLVTMNHGWFGGNAWIRADMIVGSQRIVKNEPLAVLHYVGFTPPRSRKVVSGPWTEQEITGFINASEIWRRVNSSEMRGSAGGGTQGRPPYQSLLLNKTIISTIPAKESPEGTSDSRVVTLVRCETPIYTTPLENLDKKQTTAMKEHLPVWSYKNPQPTFQDQRVCRSMERPGFFDVSPQYYDEEILLNATFDVDSFGFFKAYMNGLSYNPGGNLNQMPAIFRVMRNQIVPQLFVPNFTPRLFKVVQLVINNLNGGDHPWHLHGHTFWVLATGEEGDGAYDPARDAWKLSGNAIRRDTTHTPPQSWTVVRYIVDNPGVWLLHCHINWHMEIGLGTVFVELNNELMTYSIPQEARRVCRRSNIEI